MVANIGDGDAVVAIAENQDMVASLERSTQAANPHTKRTARLTPEQWLEIVQQTLHDYRASGGLVAIKYLPLKHTTAIVLSDVFHCESCGNLSIGGKCHYCKVGGKTLDTDTES